MLSFYTWELLLINKLEWIIILCGVVCTGCGKKLYSYVFLVFLVLETGLYWPNVDIL